MSTMAALMFGGGHRVCVVAVKHLENSRRGIYGRAMRETIGVPARPRGFNWREKEYTLWRSWFDRTADRFDDNTKVVVVDGPIAVGKTNFAKQLAQDLDMKHFEEVTVDHIYLGDFYGKDMRELDPLLPESCRTFDHEDFCKNPNHINAANFQILSYMCRYSQYIDAVAHMLNTGQGVVLERSPFSDFVFADAMSACGFMSKTARSIYGDIRDSTITQIVRPHLVVYLDIPVNTVKERVATRNLPFEKNSKVFNDKYLETMDKSYKEKYLKDISEHSLMLVYDWTGYGDIEVVIEDIEKLDFDCYGRWDDKKLKDFRLFKHVDWNDMRMLYSQYDSKNMFMADMYVPRLDCPELLVSGQDMYEFNKLLDNTPGYQYAPGYESTLGENITFRQRYYNRDKAEVYRK